MNKSLAVDPVNGSSVPWPVVGAERVQQNGAHLLGGQGEGEGSEEEGGEEEEEGTKGGSIGSGFSALAELGEDQVRHGLGAPADWGRTR